MKYAWAANKQKLERALGELGIDAPEEAVKARYIEMAGKILNDDGAPFTDAPVVEDEPKKKAAKKK